MTPAVTVLVASVPTVATALTAASVLIVVFAPLAVAAPPLVVTVAVHLARMIAVSATTTAVTATGPGAQTVTAR